jgi:hypothetical protein
MRSEPKNNPRNLKCSIILASNTVRIALKVHKHEFLYTFLAETETLWSQGPITRDFENRVRFGRDIRLLNMSAYAQGTISAYAQPAFKSFPCMLRV